MSRFFYYCWARSDGPFIFHKIDLFLKMHSVYQPFNHSTIVMMFLAFAFVQKVFQFHQNSLLVRSVAVVNKTTSLFTTSTPNTPGGASTNFYGKAFEYKTSIFHKIHSSHIQNNPIREGYKGTDGHYIIEKTKEKKVTYVSQNGLKKYMKSFYNIDLFRFPDEAYIIETANGRRIIKILEKKEQRREGSVETKLWSGPSLKREFEIMLKDVGFEVEYAFCLSSFLKEKMLSNKPKYTILKQILDENGIPVFFGDDDDYFDVLLHWINQV